MEKRPALRAISFLGMLLSWATLLLQYELILRNRDTPVIEATIRFFSFFTILSNILVALGFTALAFPGERGWRNYFSRPQTLTAIAIFIFVVGLVYNIVLRPLWNPRGMQRIVDESLHSLIPLYFIGVWLAFIPKSGLEARQVLPWMGFPLAYLILILILGSQSGYYPYPFLKVTELGYHKVLLNCGLLFLVFFAVTILFLALSRVLGRRRP